MQRLLARLALGVIVVLAGWATVGMPDAAVRGPDAALVAACCWLVRALAGWLLLGALAAVIQESAGAPGWIRRVAGPLAPAALRTVARWAGVGGLAAAVAASVPATAAASAHGGPHHHRAAPGNGATGSTSDLRLDWPVPDRPQRPVVAPPTATPRPATSPQTERRSAPGESAGRPGDRHEPRARQQPAPVVVQPGDSLWSIAARHLSGGSDAEITHAWHAWWRVNRRVVGPNPNLILPGERLLPPAGTHHPTSRRQP